MIAAILGPVAAVLIVAAVAYSLVSLVLLDRDTTREIDAEMARRDGGDR